MSKEFLTKLRNINNIRAEEWCPETFCSRSTEELLFRSNELGGECGEAMNVIKKLARSKMNLLGGLKPLCGIPLLEDELADILICVDRVASFYDINLITVTKRKFNATSDKYNLRTKFNE